MSYQRIQNICGILSEWCFDAIAIHFQRKCYKDAAKYPGSPNQIFSNRFAIQEPTYLNEN